MRLLHKNTSRNLLSPSERKYDSADTQTLSMIYIYTHVYILSNREYVWRDKQGQTDEWHHESTATDWTAFKQPIRAQLTPTMAVQRCSTRTLAALMARRPWRGHEQFRYQRRRRSSSLLLSVWTSSSQCEGGLWCQSGSEPSRSGPKCRSDGCWRSKNLLCISVILCLGAWLSVIVTVWERVLLFASRCHYNKTTAR